MSSWELLNEPDSVGGQTVIRLAGDFDVFASGRLRELLVRHLEAGHVQLVLDLTDLKFIDSAGLRVLIDSDRDLRQAGGALTLRSPSKPVLRMLDLTGIRSHFTIA